MGKVLAGFILVSALVAGVGMYYLQVYHYYDDVTDVTVIDITPAGVDTTVPMAVTALSAIDATSSPIRFRACFKNMKNGAELSDEYEPYPQAEPLTAPGWFDCFDAAEIGAALETGAARAFLGTRDIVYGIDRVIAVMPDGRGFAWHQINRCGEVVFDGKPVPDGCPPPPESDLPPDA